MGGHDHLGRSSDLLLLGGKDLHSWRCGNDLLWALPEECGRGTPDSRSQGFLVKADPSSCSVDHLPQIWVGD